MIELELVADSSLRSLDPLLALDSELGVEKEALDSELAVEMEAVEDSSLRLLDLPLAVDSELAA